MVATSINTRRWIILCLITTLVVGMFAFVAPTHASMTSAPETGSMDSTPSSTTACFAQGCVQTHDACKQHCVRPSNQSANEDAMITSQSTQQVDSERVQTCLRYVPNSALTSVAIFDRAPPIHLFLRSVIKRE